MKNLSKQVSVSNPSPGVIREAEYVSSHNAEASWDHGTQGEQLSEFWRRGPQMKTRMFWGIWCCVSLSWKSVGAGQGAGDAQRTQTQG